MNIRTLVLGDSNTGKTMFIRHSDANDAYIPTIGENKLYRGTKSIIRTVSYDSPKCTF